MSERRILAALSRRQALGSLTVGGVAAWLGKPDFAMTAEQPSVEKAQMAEMPTAFFYHPDFLKHNPGPHHPECSQRLTKIIERLNADHLWEKLSHPEPKPASLETIALVHDPSYIKLAQREIQEGRASL